ncbi:phosphotransferase [Streptomyces zagrosensis]|uniref:CHK kinase-like domain-containing protein n=1 Tax=Streptomyces zagrosensis TaxID=1042984 RepID=A0A7W9V1S0_9ACTN|nr:phosphotransferase [Streptomyces zagrosensis]MBB5938536.1 hypothetical protein [Streptomyces zagrosensis]
MAPSPRLSSVLDKANAAESAETLTGLLRDGGALPGDGRVVASRVARMGGSGLVGAVARVHLEYAAGKPAGPASLVLKTASDVFDEGPQLAAMEVKFYRGVVPTLPEALAPLVVGSGLDERTGQSWLLLEDLGDSGFVRQIDGYSDSQALAAVRKLAVLHAHWWGRDLPRDLRWLTAPQDSAVAGFCARWLRSYGGPWPTALGDAPRRLLAGYDKLAARLGASPRTVVHGDFHSQNIAFGSGGQSHDARFIDFQFVQHGCGPLDVARLLATSLRTEVRREIETALVREYHGTLVARGVEGYELDRCVDDIRAALPWNLATPLALHVMGIQREGRHWPLRLPIVERCLAAIDDWGAWNGR